MLYTTGSLGRCGHAMVEPGLVAADRGWLVCDQLAPERGAEEGTRLDWMCRCREVCMLPPPPFGGWISSSHNALTSPGHSFFNKGILCNTQSFIKPWV